MKKLLSLLLLLTAFLCVYSQSATVSNIVSNRAEAASYSEVQAMHILVSTEQEANDIRAEILKGANKQEIFNNFMNAAKKYSKCPSGKSGGMLGWFGKGDMVPEFETAAFNLANGQVSEPVKTSYGWHLIYVISKK